MCYKTLSTSVCRLIYFKHTNSSLFILLCILGVLESESVRLIVVKNVWTENLSFVFWLNANFIYCKLNVCKHQRYMWWMCFLYLSIYIYICIYIYIIYAVFYNMFYKWVFSTVLFWRMEICTHTSDPTFHSLILLQRSVILLREKSKIYFLWCRFRHFVFSNAKLMQIFVKSLVSFLCIKKDPCFVVERENNIIVTF